MKLGKIKFAIVKHSPEILIAAGIVGTVVSAVMACKATLKIDDILTEHQESVEKIKTGAADETLTEYTEKDARKDLALTYARTCGKLIRLYAPAVAVGAFSLGAVFASNEILRRRNVALAAAYTAVNDGFKKYRDRVLQRFGEAVDAELKNGVKTMEVKKEIENEDGKKQKVKKAVQTLESESDLSEYAVIFDERNPNWESGGSDYNKWFLHRMQCQVNDKLKAQGYLYLNDVYKMLGIEPTPAQRKAGQVVGWVYQPDAKNPNGDNYVDFGVKEVCPTYILDPDKPAPDLDDIDPVFVLDFNVDGNIWDMM